MARFMATAVWALSKDHGDERPGAQTPRTRTRSRSTVVGRRGLARGAGIARAAFGASGPAARPIAGEGR